MPLLSWPIIFLGGRLVTVERVSTEEYGALAVRPKNSRMSKASLDAGGFARLPAWEASLAGILEKEKSG